MSPPSLTNIAAGLGPGVIQYDDVQGSKGIRQWLKNWCASQTKIDKITSFCRLQLVVETFGHLSL